MKNKKLIIGVTLVGLLMLLSLFVCFLSQNDSNENIIPDNNPAEIITLDIPTNEKTGNLPDVPASSNDIEELPASDSSDTAFTPEDDYINPDYVLSSPSGTIIEVSKIDFSELPQYFIVNTVPDDVYEYIYGKSYVDNDEISLDDLRYVKLLHYNYEHQIQIGELIVNKQIAEEISEIFLTLFNNEYEIYSMYLPDRYYTGDGNTTDSASCDADNTSAFYYRTVDGSKKLSNHACGMAIDINPRENPYVSYKSGKAECEHENALGYIDRSSDADHMIKEDDLCYRLFMEKGYTWGGSWKNIKDYQHFQK